MRSHFSLIHRATSYVFKDILFAVFYDVPGLVEKSELITIVGFGNFRVPNRK